MLIFKEIIASKFLSDQEKKVMLSFLQYSSRAGLYSYLKTSFFHQNLIVLIQTGEIEKQQQQMETSSDLRSDCGISTCPMDSIPRPPSSFGV